VDTTITDVHFQAIANLSGVYNGSIAWFIYADNSGSPGEVQSSGVATVPLVSLGPAALDGYTTSQRSYANFYMAAAAGGSSGNGAESDLLGVTFQSSDHAHYFKLTDDAAVPEPSCLILVGAGPCAGTEFEARREKPS